MELYIKNVFNKECWKQRISIISNYINNLKDILTNEKFLANCFNFVLDGLNDIVNHKHVKKFIIESIIGRDSKYCEIVEITMGNWNVIRNKLLKCSFSGVIEEKDILKIEELLFEIKKCEESIYLNLS